MKSKLLTAFLLSAGMSIFSAELIAAPVSTAFTYQGSLADNGSPANGATEMGFQLWDSVSGGAQVGSTIIVTVDVVDGVFSELLDFGAGSYSVNQALWLEIVIDGQSLGRTPLNATPFSLNTRGITVLENNNVGIGRLNPQERLHVIGNALVDERLIAQAVETRSANASSRYLNTGNDDGWFVYNYQTDSEALFIDRNTNRVGIGRRNPQANLHVTGNSIVSGNMTAQSVQLSSANASSRYLNVGNDEGWYVYNYQTDSEAIFIDRNTNRIGIGRRSPSTALDIEGAVTIRGGADIVEGFESVCGTAFEPGTVLVIDPNNPGMLMCSEVAYDGKVAGVVSGANGIKPGIKLGQDGVMDGDIPVAMTGRVYVKCSTENGNIQPGDLLTTSSLSGHAMKSTDRDLSHGSVIGKAMTGLDESTGMVLVLVNLQ